MKIEWNKVTSYSKITAAVIFIILPFVGFYFGASYGDKTGFIRCVTDLLKIKVRDSESFAYRDVLRWVDYSREDAAFSMKFPIDLNKEDLNGGSRSADWRLNAGDTTGNKLITLVVPKAFDPGTNFSEAKLTVGESADKKAVSSCLVPGSGDSVSKRDINGTEMTVFRLTDAGAGNFYETVSYRTVKNNRCYAIEYTIHSTNIDNYPDSYKLKPFNREGIVKLLERMTETAIIGQTQ